MANSKWLPKIPLARQLLHSRHVGVISAINSPHPQLGHICQEVYCGEIWYCGF